MRAILFGALAACSGPADDTGTAPALSWFPTCGPPACSTTEPPPAGVPACVAGEEQGATCADEGRQCVVPPALDSCAGVLQCSATPLIDSAGGCPISRASAKRDIAYLDAAAIDRAAAELQAFKLATWNYRWEGDAARPHLGFVIDDVPASVAVAPDGRTVDLYGYVSLAVAALQAQQARIDTLQAEVDALRAEADAQTCATR